MKTKNTDQKIHRGITASLAALEGVGITSDQDKTAALLIACLLVNGWRSFSFSATLKLPLVEKEKSFKVVCEAGPYFEVEEEREIDLSVLNEKV